MVWPYEETAKQRTRTPRSFLKTIEDLPSVLNRRQGPATLCSMPSDESPDLRSSTKGLPGFASANTYTLRPVLVVDCETFPVECTHVHQSNDPSLSLARN
jgi:hypothetical protein